MRRLLPGLAFGFIALMLSAVVAAARANDVAQAEVIGFSADGAYVAFEQYGVQDGSGFAYSDIFLIDLVRDAWVEGTPVRVVIEDFEATEAAARAAAMQRAQPLLRQIGIEPGRTGHVLLRHEPTDRSVDPHAARFVLFADAPLVYELRIAEREVPAPDCPEDFGPVKLFDLTLGEEGGAQRVLHSDTVLPKSRGCPLGYAIGQVWLYDGDGWNTADGQSLLVLLHMRQPGFEGPDLRFLAVGVRPADLKPF